MEGSAALLKQTSAPIRELIGQLGESVACGWGRGLGGFGCTGGPASDALLVHDRADCSVPSGWRVTLNKLGGEGGGWGFWPPARFISESLKIKTSYKEWADWEAER